MLTDRLKLLSDLVVRAAFQGSLKREVQKKDEAATRCAELLCSHPSMCIEAWIGRAPLQMKLRVRGIVILVRGSLSH